MNFDYLKFRYWLKSHGCSKYLTNFINSGCSTLAGLIIGDISGK